MINVVSFELSEKLFEASARKWYSNYVYLNTRTEENPFVELEPFTYTHFVGRDGVLAPAYDLGDMREKLLDSLSKGSYLPGEYENLVAVLMTKLIPGEDITARLAIEWFRQGILALW